MPLKNTFYLTRSSVSGVRALLARESRPVTVAEGSRRQRPDLRAAVEDDVPAHDRRPYVDIGDVLGVDGPR